MIVWLILALIVSVRAPGASYLFLWPLLFAAASALLTRWRAPAEWIAAVVSIMLIAGFTYGVAVVMLGVVGTGAVALGVLTSLVALLLIPQIKVVAGDARVGGALWVAAARVRA